MIARAKWVARKVLGVLLIVVGLLLVPLPGPGWPFLLAGATLLGYGPHLRRATRCARLRVRRAMRRPRPTSA